MRLYLYFTTNEEHGKSLQRSSDGFCKSYSSYRLVTQSTPVAAWIPPSDRSWPSASKCLPTQDPLSSLTIHSNATAFYSRSSVTSRTINQLNQSINQSESGICLHQLLGSAANTAHENSKCNTGTELLFYS